MKQRSSKLPPVSASSGVVLGRSAFRQISAVEGIKLSKESETLFSDFDRQGLSAEERRRALLERHARKA
ncbi:hypothetical protein [Pleomorphomonas carboxyditropha]|uniref:Uncharacterized protein n=1 Tax=Pleomorphomonas carboxyditropha TaxID=2023338 RepID=A0A2G9WQJ1_9HYPH|nr:hypothetical protein [Pleomorphomonas carboxyditropha]PIO96966.1 hypothetical protein CJ014_22775 [Pleomorphomonas carboxyditropha]